MNKRSLINEEEKLRILNLHETRKSKEWNLVNEQVTTAATPTTTAATPTTSAATPTTETKVLNDRDYVYKKEGDKYFFKLQTNPGSDAAKKLKTSNKYVNWTEATGKGLDAIKKLNWGQSENLALKPASAVTVTSQTNLVQTTGGTTNQVAGGGGGTPQLALGAIGEAQKLMPNIKSLDPMKQAEVANWAKSPAGQYVIKLAPEQRESGLDNLDRVRGDKETRRLKKEIRTALGMMADTGVGRLGQRVQGAVQGAKQGFQNPIPPAK
jgi:hypothetical protein